MKTPHRRSAGKIQIVPIRPSKIAAQEDSDPGAQQQLERVLASVTFRQVDRLKRFLSFTVSEALAGRGDQLKEYVIGVQVFDKDSSFDPRADPIVRVQARRLRARLARYYREEGGADAVLIDLPKGGYTPVFKTREASAGGRRSMGPTLAGQNTIAVQAIADQSPAHDLGYFCDGLRQEIIHSLAKLEALRVLAVTPAGTAGGGYAVEPAGHAAMVLTGSVRKSGECVRATVHLVDTATASYLWSESVDAPLGDAFAAQELVAEAVVKKLEPRLLDAGQRRGARQPAENLAARNLYLQGRLDEAVAAFQRAIDLSPHSPRWGAGRARARALAGKKPLALHVLRKLDAIAAQRYVSPIEFASVRFALGQRDLGFKWLDRSCEDRAFDVLALKVDPRFDAEKHDPRMQAIFRIVGLA